MTTPNEPPADELALVLKAIARPHPTDPTIIEYERQGKVIAWNRLRRPEKP